MDKAAEEVNRVEWGIKMYWTSKSLIVVLICLLFAGSCSKAKDSMPPGVAAACPSPSPKIASGGKLKLFVPDTFWAEYFSVENPKYIVKARLNDLKTVVLTGSDLEVRIWAFAFNDIGCLVFKRTNGKWDALKIPMRDSDEAQYYSEPYPEPASGWNAFWDKLVGEGLLTLPDSSCFKDEFAVLDGIGFVVEINLGGNYRLYSYSNPSIRTLEHGATDLNGIAAAKRMDTITSLIFDRSFFPQNK